MRIAYIIPSLLNVGPNVVIHSLVTELKAYNCEIDVFYFDHSHGLAFPSPVYNIHEHMIDFDRYDIIHSNMYRPDKFIFKHRNKIVKAKLVTTIHQDIYANLKSTYNRFIASIYTPIWLRYMSAFDVTVPISYTIHSLYNKRINNLSNVIHNGVNVLYNPMDADKEIMCRIKDFCKNNTITLGTYAYLTPRKGIDQLISLLKYRHDIGVIIIGEGDAKMDLINLTIRNKVDSRVLFLPYLKSPYNYLQYIDVYAMPSHSEGFGLALAEVAYTMTPVVCSNIPVFREIFDDTQASYFTLGDMQSLSNAVDDALVYRTSRINNAYNRVQDHFSKEIMAKKYLELYKSIL